MKFATLSRTGYKLWIAVKEKEKGIIAKLFKDYTNIDCCSDVHHFEKEIF